MLYYYSTKNLPFIRYTYIQAKYGMEITLNYVHKKKIDEGLKQNGRKTDKEKSGKENIIQKKSEAAGGQWCL